MKCVFISSPHNFVVQFHSPVVVELGAKGWELNGATGAEKFSIYPKWPVKFMKGDTAVFLPVRVSRERDRQKLFEAFQAANPGVAHQTELDADQSAVA